MLLHRCGQLTTIVVLLAVGGATVAGAHPARQDPSGAPQSLKGLSIEDLMTIDVTSANRREEPIGSTAAAVSVITRDDIRRSGVTTLADALLLADGVEVARLNTGTWAITPRGFNQNAANKLLVMVDGVTEYSPLFTGVFWNTLDYVLDDIDRIEVIRGPGAVLWGANAVNGVVNIITRSARQTQGGFGNLTFGNEDAIAEGRYGGGSTSGPAWRAYGKFAMRDAQALASGASSHDSVDRGQVGFRVDGGAEQSRTWLIRGDLFHSSDDIPDRDDGEFTNATLQARWSALVSPGSRLTLQTYYRREYRRVPLQLTHHVDTIDVDAQHTWSRGRHDLVWGGGFRVNDDGTEGGTVQFDPAARTYHVANAFAQDEFAVVPNRVFATLGAKWEHNAFSGGEFQPNVRARVRLPRGQMAWGAVSRAVRRPTRFEDDLIIPSAAGVPLIEGSDAFEAESLVAVEGGYRAQPLPFASLDLAVFHHTIDHLRSQEAPLVGVVPITIGNSLIGHAHGIEAAINIQPALRWRNHVSYTWLNTTIDRAAASRDVSGGSSEANDPHQQFHLRSSLDLPHNVEVDALLRAVSALPNPAVPAYTELTMRVGWTATPRLELSFTGQDLLHDHHPEFGAPLATRVAFERSLRGGLAFRF